MNRSRRVEAFLLSFTVMLLLGPRVAADEQTERLAERLRTLNPNVIDVEGRPDSAQREQLRRMLRDDVRARLREANRLDLQAWRQVTSRTDWEKLRDTRLEALRRSLGTFPPVPADLNLRTTGVIDRDGFRIRNIVFESRPGLLVTANLYEPSKPSPSMPGILICHSHHNPKTQSELQDMGVTWARRGCLALVMDQLGHGERRQHPFRTADDYAGSFRVSRQDYHFRYNVGMQLHLIGESLIGWMAWDLMRGVDVLLGQTGIDKQRIILLGSVAGGGDPAAVTAALDRRIAAVVPFNFGGPQPESVYPLPDDAEQSFNYSGSGSWESTRNLRLSARDGFLPWVIVGSVAPRRLIYAHEFTWDRDRDPVWKRLQTLYVWYGAADALSSVSGYGKVSLSSSAASHCNNIGPVHRQQIDPALERWFQIRVPNDKSQEPLEAHELLCLEGVEAANDLRPRFQPVYQLARQLADERIKAFRSRQSDEQEQRRQSLRTAWSELLGDIKPYQPRIEWSAEDFGNGSQLERGILRGEREIAVPVVLLLPPQRGCEENVGHVSNVPVFSTNTGTLKTCPTKSSQPPREQRKRPVVVMFAQAGKAAFLQARSAAIAEFLKHGVAFCLPDVRGTGESRLDVDRGRQSEATSVSSTEMMLGQTVLGARLRDLRSLLTVLRERPDLDPHRIALWGDSFAEVNPPDAPVAVPLGVDNEPKLAEPLGQLLALLGGFFEADVAAIVSARGGLTSFRSALESPFLYLPHDAIIPAVLTAGDLCDVAAALAPRPLLMAGLVDARNRTASQSLADADYAPATQAFDAANRRAQFRLTQQDMTSEDAAMWLIGHLQR